MIIFKRLLQFNCIGDLNIQILRNLTVLLLLCFMFCEQKPSRALANLISSKYTTRRDVRPLLRRKSLDVKIN